MRRLLLAAALLAPLCAHAQSPVLVPNLPAAGGISPSDKVVIQQSGGTSLSTVAALAAAGIGTTAGTTADGGALTSEIARAQAAEATKAATTALTAETTRATTAEGTNATAASAAQSTANTAASGLSSEITRAQAAEALRALASGGTLTSPILNGSITGSAVGPASTQIAPGCSTASSATNCRSAAATQGDVVNVRQFAPAGGVGTTKQYYDGAITAGQTALTSASAGFSAASVGNPILVRGAGASGASLVTTIAAYTGGNSVTLSVSASTTVSGAIVMTGTDDTAAVTAATAYAQNQKECLYFPGGSGGYWLYSQTTSIQMQWTCWVGDGAVSLGADYTQTGSVIMITNTTASPINLQRADLFRNMTFYWPAQDGSQVSPIAYPPLFDGNYVENDNFENVQFINPYDLMKIEAGSGGLGDVKMSNVRAYCVDKCFWFLNGAPDVLQITNSFFSPGVYEDVSLNTNSYLAKYTGANGAMVYIDSGAGAHTSVDGFQMSNSLLFGYRYGVRIVSGQANLMSWTGITFDQVPTPLSVEGAASWTQLAWTGGTVVSLQFGAAAGSDTATAVNLACNSGIADINITGVNFSQVNGDLINEGGSCTHFFTLSGNKFANWGLNKSGNTYAIYELNNASNLVVVGNNFGCLPESNSPIGVILNSVTALIATNNFYGSCSQDIADIASSGSILVSGNISAATSGSNALNDLTTGSAVIYETGNSWDKNSNKSHPNLQNSVTLHPLGASPTVTAGSTNCGTSPTVATGAADGAGAVTVGTSTNGGICPIVFSQPHSNAPDCHATDQTTTAVALTAAATTTGVTPKGSLVAGDRVTWSCTFYQ